jgi:hypothetical protein
MLLSMLIALALAMGHHAESWMLGPPYHIPSQINNQLQAACTFNKTSIITKLDPFVGNCQFEIMVDPYYEGAERTHGCLRRPMARVSAKEIEDGPNSFLVMLKIITFLQLNFITYLQLNFIT